MEQKVILFDLDGTLTDSGEGIISCVVFALEHYGLPVPSKAELRSVVGPPLHDTLARYGVPKEKLDEAVTVFRSRYNPIGIYENVPYPGIREALEELKREGYKLCVATSKPEEMANRVLRHFDLAGYFDTVCGGTLDESRSSKSEVIAYLLEQNGRADKRASGLGLYLCSRICRNLGVGLTVKSTSGVGTTLLLDFTQYPLRVE